MARTIRSIFTALLALLPVPRLSGAAQIAVLKNMSAVADRVTLDLSEQVPYKISLFPAPPRLVINLSNTETSAPETAPGDGTVMKQVRAALFQREPAAVTRVVVDLVKPVTYSSSWEGSKLTVTIEAADAAPVSKRTAVLGNVLSDPQGVTLKLSKRVRYRMAIFDSPPRLIINLSNTKSSAPEVVAGDGRILKQVRSALFRRGPAPTTRIVLDLLKTVTYSSAWEGSDLTIKLSAAAQSEAPPQPPPLPGYNAVKDEPAAMPLVGSTHHYQVRVGPFDSRHQAETAAQTLTREGYSAEVLDSD